MDTVSHDNDSTPQRVCARCKSAGAEELLLNTGVFTCEECRSMVVDLLARVARSRCPTPELALAILTDSDKLLSPLRLQRLEHMRTVIWWAATAANALADPAIKDDQFHPEYLKDIDAVWVRMHGKKGEKEIGALAAMQITAHILAAAGAKDEAAITTAFNWLSASWQTYFVRMKFEKFKAAVVGSVKAPDYYAIADLLESAGVGDREWDHETIRTEYQRWSAEKDARKAEGGTVPGLSVDDLLHRK